MRRITYMGIGAGILGAIFTLNAVYRSFTKPEGIVPGKYRVNAVTYDGGKDPLCGNDNPGWIKIDVDGKEDIAVPCKKIPTEQAKEMARRIADAEIIEVLSEPTDRYRDRNGNPWAVLPTSRFEIDETENF